MSVLKRLSIESPVVSNCRTYLSFRWGKKKNNEECKKDMAEKQLKPLFYEMFGEDAEMPPELKKVCEKKTENQRHDFFKKQDEIPGVKYKACGSTILLQVDSKLPDPDTPAFNKELRRLERIEAHPTLKDKIGDPIPPYTTAEQRMVDMSDRKLHPLHQKMMTIPKRKVAMCEENEASNKRDKAVSSKRVSIDTALLEKKNILFDLKRVEPPKEIVYKGFEQKLKHLAQLKHMPISKLVPVRLKCPKHGNPDKKTTNISK